MLRLFLIVLCFSSCVQNTNEELNQNIDSKSKVLLQKTIDATGGLDHFKRIKKLRYKKSFSLLDSAGQIEKKYDQKHEYDYPNQFFKISSIESGDTIISIKDGGSYSRFKNGIKLNLDKSAIERSINSSLFIIGNPFNLLDKNARIEYIGEKKIDAQTFDIIQANYDSKKFKNHSSSEPWRFYISKNTGLIKHCWIESVDHFNIVDNLEFDIVEGFYFYKFRKSFRSDSLGNKLYLRANYHYYDYQIEMIN